MAAYDLPLTGPDSLDSFLVAGGLSSSAAQAIINTLANEGDSGSISVQVGGYPPFQPDANGNLKWTPDLGPSVKV